MDNLRHTPVYANHLALGARMVPFAGWEMPVQYCGVLEEHMLVRNACGLFDVSHMGEIEISGTRALEAVQLLTTNDVSSISAGQVQYTLLCNEEGGVVDDVTLYKFSGDKFMLCVNASNTAKVFSWIKQRVGGMAEVRDISGEIGQIALQGPFSADILQSVTDRDIKSVAYYHFIEANVGGVAGVVSRTGYTGEDGFEIYTNLKDITDVWSTLLKAGDAYGVRPAGLGARDTLRLEMGYPLYGHELDETHTPIEAGLDRFVKLDKRDFIGKDALCDQKEHGLRKRLIGLKALEQGIPRQGYRIVNDGKEVGIITSGTFSPSLRVGIALGYIEAGLAPSISELQIVIRKRLLKAEVTDARFYKRMH